MRIRDVQQFRKRNQISETDYRTSLGILCDPKTFLTAIGDYRFERIGQGVTREELDSYLKDSLISKELHARAIQKLERVEKIKKAVGEKHSSIASQTREQVARLVEENDAKLA